MDNVDLKKHREECSVKDSARCAYCYAYENMKIQEVVDRVTSKQKVERISKKIKEQLTKFRNFWRSINNKCIYCGGDTWDWDWNKTYCKVCDKRQ